MAIFSLAAGIETKPCCAPSPPRCRDVDRVTAGDTRGCCCRCTGTSTEGGCAGEDSGGATVACGAGGRNAGNDSGGAAVTGVGSCCCGTDDAAGRGVDEDSGVTPVDGVDGWYHTPKPRGMQYCAVPGSNGCVDAPRWPTPRLCCNTTFVVNSVPPLVVTGRTYPSSLLAATAPTATGLDCCCCSTFYCCCCCCCVPNPKTAEPPTLLSPKASA